MRCYKTISNVTELRRLQSRKHIKFTTRLHVVVKASESVVKSLHLAGLHVQQGSNRSNKLTCRNAVVVRFLQAALSALL